MSNRSSSPSRSQDSSGSTLDDTDASDDDEKYGDLSGGAESHASTDDEMDDAVELEPGSRAARLYELLAVDLWWSLGMMGVACVIATALFVATTLVPLRVAGFAVGLGTATVYAGRLVWLRGATGTRLDEWAVIAAEAATLIALTETTAVILDLVGDGLL